MSDRESREHDARVERIAGDQWEREQAERRALLISVWIEHCRATGCELVDDGPRTNETCPICGVDLLGDDELGG